MVVPLAFGLGILVMMQSCASAAAGPGGTRVAIGTWGGQHVALTVTEAGAQLEFDCASGEISQPLTIDASGTLAVDGVFVRQHHGRQRVGEEPEQQPARYAGKIEGDTLKFEVTLKNSKESMGTYVVTRGAAAQVRKCR